MSELALVPAKSPLLEQMALVGSRGAGVALDLTREPSMPPNSRMVRAGSIVWSDSAARPRATPRAQQMKPIPGTPARSTSNISHRAAERTFHVHIPFHGNEDSYME